MCGGALCGMRRTRRDPNEKRERMGGVFYLEMKIKQESLCTGA